MKTIIGFQRRSAFSVTGVGINAGELSERIERTDGFFYFFFIVISEDFFILQRRSSVQIKHIVIHNDCEVTGIEGM